VRISFLDKSLTDAVPTFVLFTSVVAMMPIVCGRTSLFCYFDAMIILFIVVDSRYPLVVILLLPWAGDTHSLMPTFVAVLFYSSFYRSVFCYDTCIVFDADGDASFSPSDADARHLRLLPRSFTYFGKAIAFD